MSEGETGLNSGNAVASENITNITNSPKNVDNQTKKITSSVHLIYSTFYTAAIKKAKNISGETFFSALHSKIFLA